MPKLEEHCRTELKALAKAERLRELKESTVDGVMVTQNGQKYLSFAGNDYLGLAQHPEVIAAASAALVQYGAGAGASRLVTGNHPLYAKLEAQLARMKRAEAARVFGSGYLANLGIIPAIMGKNDILFADRLAHACMLDGVLLSGAAAFKRFRHNDMVHLEALLVEHRGSYENALVLVEHVYSMDGDVAPLAHLNRLAREYDVWLMVDDAHGLGMLKPDPAWKIDLWMGTLSKSAGGYGGYVIAKKPVVELLASKARSLLFSTALPPSVCAAALAALEIMDDEPERGEIALRHAKKMCDVLRIPYPGSAIVPIIVGADKEALDAAELLKKRGILAAAIRPPTVAPGTARLRFTFTAAHTEEQVEQLLSVLIAEKIRPIPCTV